MKQLKVNQQLWESVSQSDRDDIITKLQSTGILQPTDTIVGDPATPAVTTAQPTFQGLSLVDGACQQACTAFYEEACSTCAGLGVPQAAAVCYGAAAAAYGACLAACLASD